MTTKRSKYTEADKLSENGDELIAIQIEHNSITIITIVVYQTREEKLAIMLTKLSYNQYRAIM